MEGAFSEGNNTNKNNDLETEYLNAAKLDGILYHNFDLTLIFLV